MAEHDCFMDRCLELSAVAGRGGNTPVGSVVVLDGRIVGEAEGGSISTISPDRRF